MSDATEQIYARSELGGHLRWGARPAVVVVDLTYGFTDPAFRLGAQLDPVVESTARLLVRARGVGVRVALTRIAFDERQMRSSIWLQKVPALADLRNGTRATEIDERLGPRLDEPTVTKQLPSAMFGTTLDETLRTWGTDTVVLCGATTSGCVRATAIDLMQAGFPTVIPEECVGDRAPEAHRASVIDLQAKYADVVSLDAALAYLASLTDQPLLGRTVRGEPDS